jgi:hypothetical protein
MADILMRNALSLVDQDARLTMDPVLTSRAMIGASMEILVDWINGDVDATREEIVEHLTRMYTAVADASVASED